MKKEFYISYMVAMVMLAPILISCSSEEEYGNFEECNNSYVLDNSLKDYSDGLPTNLFYYLKFADPDIVKDMTMEQKVRTAKFYKLTPYISLKDSVYSLDITAKGASDIGIEEAFYKEVKRSLDAINLEIERINQCANETIDLINFQHLISAYDTQGNNTIAELYPKPQSGIICSDGGWAYDAGQPDINKTRVSFLCRSNSAIICLMSCSLEQWNNVRIRNGVCPIGGTVTISLNLFVSGSGVGAILGFFTADPNGGVANWSFF